MEGVLAAKIEGLERQLLEVRQEMRLEMQELRKTMGQMIGLLTQFTSASAPSEAVPSEEIIPPAHDVAVGEELEKRDNKRQVKPTDEEGGSETYDLPVELWLHIFGFVSQQQRNAKGQQCTFASLSSILLTSRFWRKLGLASVGAYILPPTKPRKLVWRCLPFIFANCPNLRELCLRNCPVVDSMLTGIPKGTLLPFLRRAVELPPLVEILSLRDTSVTSHLFHRIKHKFPQLRTLYLSARKNRVPPSRLPPSLQKLSLHPGQMPDERKRFMYNDKCLRDISLLRHLTQLDLFHVNLSNEGMRKLKDLALVSLQIVGGMFEDEGLTFLPPSLVSLRVARAKGITDAGLLYIASSLQRLGLTKLENVTAEGIARFLRTAKPQRLQLVVEEATQTALLAMADFPADRVSLSADKHLFYERGGCGLYYC